MAFLSGVHWSYIYIVVIINPLLLYIVVIINHVKILKAPIIEKIHAKAEYCKRGWAKVKVQGTVLFPL
jgi:hypothetical protein